jgi:hypothetical protein
LVLWLNQVTRRFCGEPPQTPRADSGREPLPCTGSCPRLCLVFLPPCGPHSTPLATESLKLSLLVSPLLGGPPRYRPFTLALHLHQRKSNRNLHLQYSAKSQSTPHCQSLITARSHHPSVLGRSGPQSPPYECIDTSSHFREKRKRKETNEKLKQVINKPVVWTSLGPLPRWVPGPTTRWASGTNRLALHGT